MKKPQSTKQEQKIVSASEKTDKGRRKAKSKKNNSEEQYLRFSVTKTGVLIELPYFHFAEIYKGLFPAAADKLFIEGEYDPSICIRLEMSFSAVLAFYRLMDAYPEHKLSNLKGLLHLYAIVASDEDRKRLADFMKRLMAHIAPKAKKQVLTEAESRNQRSVRWIARVLTAMEKGELLPEKQQVKRSGRPSKTEQQEREFEERRKNKARYKSLLGRKPGTKAKPSGKKNS